MSFNKADNTGVPHKIADPGKMRLGVWNRLEPRPRSTDFNKALTASIHDPLFFLAKQWLFGEFKGEDTGSAVMAKVSLKSNPVSRFNLPGQAPVGYNNSIPLEARIEAEPVPLDYSIQTKITAIWKKILKAKNLPATVFQAFLEVFPFSFPLDQDENDSFNPVDSDAKTACPTFESFYTDALGKGVRCKLQALSGKMMQAENFLEYIKTVGPGTILFEQETLDSQLAADVLAYTSSIKEAVDEMLDWYERLYFTPKPGDFAWDPSRLEYRFNLAVQNADGSKSALVANEYYEGDPDWYAYELDNPSSHQSNLLALGTLPGENTVVQEKHITLLSTDVDFPGMPNRRYWSFENGKLNFGTLNASVTDLSSIALAEFGLIYGNDWQLIPLEVPAGNMSSIENLVVTDCFGFKTKIEAANKNLAARDWTMFNLSAVDGYDLPMPDARVFIPPVTFKTQEGPALEKVLFLRDEMANMVWAIEQIIPDLFGEGENAYEVFHRLKNYLQAQASNTNQIPLDAATFNYIFMTATPENWIPFIPVDTETDFGATKIRLQRGRMRRNMEGVNNTDPVTPSGLLLTEVLPPYYIEEEEIPREGVQITRSFQRTRWYNGKNVCWLGRQKKTGKGEGNSGLRFDDLQPNPV